MSDKLCNPSVAQTSHAVLVRRPQESQRPGTSAVTAVVVGALDDEEDETVDDAPRAAALP